MEIIGAIISFIIEASFGVGNFLFDLLDLRNMGKQQEAQSPMSAIKKIILSIIGGFVICLLVLGLVLLILYLVFKIRLF